MRVLSPERGHLEVEDRTGRDIDAGGVRELQLQKTVRNGMRNCMQGMIWLGGVQGSYTWWLGK